MRPPSKLDLTRATLETFIDAIVFRNISSSKRKLFSCFVSIVSIQKLKSFFGSVLYRELYKGSVLLEVSVCVRGGML